MSDPLVVFALLFLAILVIVFLLVFVLGLRYEVVKQEERLVIYRFGQFARIAGPGHVFYASRIESIERRINVREENKKITIDGVFIHGVPFGYTFDLWLRNDPQAAEARSGRPLSELAQFDDRERFAQTKVAIKNALLESIGNVEQQYPLPPNAPFVAKLLPIFPGQPAFEALIKTLREKLENSLPEIGVLAAVGRPISVINISLDKQSVDGFNQGRAITLLREALPDLRSDQLLEMVAKVNGIDLNYQRLQLDRGADVDFSFEDEENGSRTRVRSYGAAHPNRQSQRSTRPAEHAVERENQKVEESISSVQSTEQSVTGPVTETAAESITIPQQVQVPLHKTTANDWQVLKRLPRQS